MVRVRALDVSRVFSPNVYVQGLTLLSGLLVAFLFPVLFGVATYGELLRLILPTLLVHRIIDAMSEALIPELSGDEIFASALAAAAVTILVASAVFYVFGLQSTDLLLLTFMAVTSVSSITMYKNSLTWEMVVYLLLFCAMFCILSMVEYLFRNIGLRNILVATNGVGAMLCVAILAYRRVLIPKSHAVWAHLWAGVRRIPRSLSATLMMNTITVGYLWIAAPLMTSAAVGQLRVLTSVVQASISIFPVSLKAIFVRLSLREGPALDMYQLLGAAFWFFLAVFCGLQVVGVVLPSTIALADLFLVSVPFFWAACIERLAQTSGRRNLYRAINLVMCPATLTAAYWASIKGVAVVSYVLVVCAYCIVLATIFIGGRKALMLVVLAGAVGAASLVILYTAISPWVVGLALAAIAALLVPPRPAIIRYYRGHI